MPTIVELLGDWITNETYPLHQNYGAGIKFHFDRLPFDDYVIGKLIVAAKTEEAVLVSGEVQIFPGENDEFFIVIGKMRIPARRFNGHSFLADIVNFGIVEVNKL